MEEMQNCDVEVDGKIISQANEGWENNIMGGGPKVSTVFNNNRCSFV